jgi:hypothetical protein
VWYVRGASDAEPSSDGGDDGCDDDDARDSD